jgi:long-subunit acyl-CoA synthetase (AMP-forming)
MQNGRRKFGSYIEAVPNDPQLLIMERVHPDGYIDLKDRSKDIIISGGENISTIEVEDVLYRHPCVIEAAVVACPDPMWGETPCAVVTLKPEASTTADKIIAFCREHLAHFKAPRTVFSNHCRRPRLAKSKNSCRASALEHLLNDPEKTKGQQSCHPLTNYLLLL